MCFTGRKKSADASESVDSSGNNITDLTAYTTVTARTTPIKKCVYILLGNFAFI